MLFLNSIFIFLLLQCVPHFTYGQAKFFRKDYKFIKDTNSFYKIHTFRKTWPEAKERCEIEGATLFYPINEDEASNVIDYWNKTQLQFELIHVGISSPYVTEVFETVDGIPISDVYNRWGEPGEPNDICGTKDCVMMRKNGTLHNISCKRKLRYICKKAVKDLTWNNLCDIADTGYEYVEHLGRCYKFHSTPKSWPDAFTVCYAEESYLSVINSKPEADHLVQLANKAKTGHVIRNITSQFVHLGFINKARWSTIKGMSLEDSGYSEWDEGQPGGGKKECCGSMTYNGRLHAIRCDLKSSFICEHEVEALKYDLTLKFR